MITIVYKTYKADLIWLRYSLMSIKKYVTGYSEIVLYCHDVCCGELYKLIDELNIQCRIIPVSYDLHGYIKQMIVKCECYKDINTKYIVIMDSDTLFKSPLDISTAIIDNKIEWIYSKKQNNNSTGPEWSVWKKAYEDQTKEIQDKHYMSNGFPFILTRKSLENADLKFREIHGVGYKEYCKKRLDNFKIIPSDEIRPIFMKLATVFEEFELI